MIRRVQTLTEEIAVMNIFKVKAIGLAMMTTMLAGAGAASAAPHDRMIKRLDTNEDGLVSLAEFMAHEHDGILKRFDANEDGALTLDEISGGLSQAHEKKRAMAAARQEKMRLKLEEHFADADTNGDEMVTVEEARMAAFTRMDEDGDGLLSREEIRKARHFRRGHKQGRHRRDRDGER